MANKGLKNYTKQISQTIGKVAKVSVNVNKEDANMHIIIPLFQTLGPNPLDLSLIWNYQDRDRIGHFGKGCNINTYKDFSDNETYISVREADGSYTSYWDEKGYNEFRADENNMTILKHVTLISGDSDEYSYEFKDQQGNKICYDNGNTYYPTSIEYANGEKTIFDGLNMDNGHGTKVTFTEYNRVRTRVTYTQDGTTLYYVDFGYDSNQKLTSVKHYKESRLVMNLSIIYSSNEITVKDEISKDYTKYTFTGNCVTKIIEVLNDNTSNTVQTSIEYEDRRTTLTDNDGRKVYIYFDNKNLPLFEIDADGNAIETEFDATTKKLISQSSIVPTKKKLDNLCSINIGDFSKDSGISTSVVSVNDSVLAEVLGTVYNVKGTGSLKYTLTTKGLGSDTITAVIWGKQKTAYTNSSKVKVTLTVDENDSDEFKKTIVDNNFDMMTLGVSAIKSYSKITLTITLTGNASIELGGIQLLKKDFGSFYQYDDKGNMTGSESGKGIVSSAYNSKGLQTKSVGKDSAMYDYEYDAKGNMTAAKTAFGGKIENTYDTFNNATKSVASNATGTKKLETTTTYENGRLVSSEKDELGNKTSYTYDSFGKIKKITDALNVTTEYSYDAFDNLTKILFNNSVSVNYSYDSQNKLKSATLPNGTTYNFGYDSCNNLNSVSMNGTLIVTFTYDQKTGLITHQKYGSSGDTFDFIYNAKYDIKQIKINGFIKYEYEYDDFDQLIQVKNGNGTTLKSYTYNNDGQVVSSNDNDLALEYRYDSLGGVNQRKRTLSSKTIYESYDSISRSKGFSPDNLIGYLQGNNDFLGTIFNGNADLKNPSYTCKPFNYKTNSETKLTYTRLGVIPCVTCGLTNPISYNPPSTPYFDNSGCIGFWFYPTSTPSVKRYLFYVKASSSNIKSYVAVYHNSSNELVLELKENSGTMNYISTNTKVQLNQWNFFGLNFRYRDDGQGYARVFSYELYLNSEQKKANLSNKTIMTDGGLYHIGYRFDGANGYDALECKITALMIGCRIMLTTKQMQEIYSLSKDYMIGSSYLDGSSVDFSATSTHNLSEKMINQFEIYPLHNSVKSLKGIEPIVYDVRRVSSTDKNRSFNYNNKIKRYAYVADEGRLEYDLNTADVGTIMMRAYIREDANKQYILECKDVGDQRIGLYRGSDKYLYIEVNGVSTKTDLYFETDIWHTVGISFYDRIENSESVQNAPYVTVRAYLNGAVYSVDRDISSTFDMFYLSVGKLFDSVKVTDAYMGNYYTYYPMLGQIEMLATRAAFCEVATLNTLANELKDTTKVSEYDELGMLQKVVLRKGDLDILTNTMNYKKRSTYSSYISKFIEKEVIKYGSTTGNRSYGIDALGNVTSVTDTTFGSHTYTYNARGYLTKEDNTEYAYDNNGNITKAGSTTFTYDTTIKDRLKAVNGKEITYGTNPLNPASWNGLKYTFEGRRLTEYQHSGGIIYYRYNDQGLRIVKYNNQGVGSKYYYDGDKLITEVASGYRLDFLYDENNQLYGFIYNNSDKYFYIRDFMQNILGIIDTSGNLVVKYSYTAYGTITEITGSLASTIGAHNPFRYKGYYYDTETTMYYCKTRYYVPAWCRWLNGDNLGFINPQDFSSLNLFIYCSNNPITGFDVDGQFDWGKLWRGVGALAVGTLVVAGIAAVTVLSGGTAAPVIVGALAGAAVSGGVSAGCQLATTGSIDVGRLLTDVAVGAVSGAFGGSALGTFGMTVSGTITGFGGSIVGDLVETGSFNGINWGAAIGSAALGGALSYMGGAGAQNGKLGGVAKMSNRMKTIKAKGITGGYKANTQKYLAREIAKVNKAAILAIKKSIPYTIFSDLIDYFI